MELLSVIRRWRYRQHFSIREIARRTGLSRNTVRKYLRSDSVEPRFNVPDRPSGLDPYADKLSQMLRQETGKSRKQKRTVRQLHADLTVLGYEGSYNRVAAFAREWKAARHREQQTCGRGAFVPLAFLAGEAFQFDWSEDWAVIAGDRTKLQVAHVKLCYSRAFILRAYPQQTHEMLFDAHNHAFRVLGGVPRRGIYDNMRTAVDKIGRGKERKVNARFSAMVSHFLFEAEFCNPASGWEKGQIEKNVQDARHRLWQPTPSFRSLAALNDWLEARCRELWAQIPHGSQATIEATLGVIFAVDAAVPLEDLAAELERLNARTPSDHWPDAVVIATKGQIAYMAKLLGDASGPGLLLPPSPSASRKAAIPFYVQLMISASSAGTFNLAMHMMLGQLLRWGGYVLTDYETILDGVPRHGLMWTGYQYNLAGELRPVPRDQYIDQALPPKSFALFPRGAGASFFEAVFNCTPCRLERSVQLVAGIAARRAVSGITPYLPLRTGLTLPWARHAVTMRVLDVDGREVYSTDQGRGVTTFLHRSRFSLRSE